MQANEMIGSTPSRLRPNRVRFWKLRISPSLQDAMAESTAYALEAYNRSIEQISDLTGLDSHWTLRKYISEVRLPAKLIRPFENACGIDLVTRYLASGANRVCIQIPTGRTPGPHDITELQRALNEAAGHLITFYSGEKSAEETLAAVWAGMSELAWHRNNVVKHDQPELPL